MRILKNNPKQVYSHTDKESLISFGVVILCLLASYFFPTKNSAQELTKNLFFLIALPVAYIKVVLGKKLADFGWNLKNKKRGLFLGINLLLFTLLIFYLLINYTKFGSTYILEDYVKNNFWLFLLHELVFVNLSVFVFSFFFQGFLLFTLQEKLARFAIIISTGLFFAFLLLSKTLSWQETSFILVSFTGGFLAYETKSFFYSYFMSFFAIIILDAYIIYLTK